MRLISRDGYIDIIERQYFGNMAAARPHLIMPLLTDDAVLTGFFGSNPPRLVCNRNSPGKESFTRFLGALQQDFILRYTQFLHVVDVELERAACTFRLEISPRDAASTTGIRILRNCNFFQFRDGLIQAVTAYFASPPADNDPWSMLI